MLQQTLPPHIELKKQRQDIQEDRWAEARQRPDVTHPHLPRSMLFEAFRFIDSKRLPGWCHRSKVDMLIWKIHCRVHPPRAAERSHTPDLGLEFKKKKKIKGSSSHFEQSSSSLLCGSQPGIFNQLVNLRYFYEM